MPAETSGPDERETMTVLPTTKSVAPALIRHQLSETALELAREFSSIPPGAVLRCFSRAVRVVRLAGTEPAEVARVARRMAELMLQSRGANRTSGGAR